MEKIKNDGVLCNELLFRMDDELVGKLKNHARKNDKTLSAIIRRSQRKFFENEELQTGQTGQKTINMK